MIHHPEIRHLLILCPRLAVVAVRIDGDPATWRKFAPHLDIARLHELDQVVHDDVDAILVEVTVIAEAEQIELERFALYHLDVGHIADVDGSEVRLSGNRAEAGEFRAVEFHEVIAVRMFIVKSLQYTWIIHVVVRGALVAQERE